MIAVKFSQEEVQAVVQLLDLAVKGGGLNVAEAAVVLAKKFQEAAKDQGFGQTPTPVPEIIDEAA